MKPIGFVMVALGVLALIYGGINYNKDRTVLEVGSVTLTATEQKRIPVPAIVGVVVLLAGVGILATGMRRPRLS